MQPFTGRLLRGGVVALDRVSGLLQLNTRPEGAQSWTGHFTVPAGLPAPSGPGYRLVLDDGRSLEIVLTATATDGKRDATVYFRGLGQPG